MLRVRNGTLGLTLGLLLASSVPALARCERSHSSWRYGESVSSVWHIDGAVCGGPSLLANVSITAIVE